MDCHLFGGHNLDEICTIFLNLECRVEISFLVATLLFPSFFSVLQQVQLAQCLDFIQAILVFLVLGPSSRTTFLNP